MAEDFALQMVQLQFPALFDDNKDVDPTMDAPAIGARSLPGSAILFGSAILAPVSSLELVLTAKDAWRVAKA